MADSDYDVIQPLESVQTIQGLTPAKRHQERKRQQDTSDEHREPSEESEEPIEEPQAEIKPPPDEDDPHSIDYCA